MLVLVRLVVGLGVASILLQRQLGTGCMQVS